MSGDKEVDMPKGEECFKTEPFKLHRLDVGPRENVTVTRGEALKYYRQMETIRRMEAVIGDLYKKGDIRGFCHQYSGQEACAVGICAAKSAEDSVISSYRIHGWTFMMGAPIAEILAELTGKLHGTCHGKGGSMHMYREHFYGGHGIVGAQIALGTGLGFAHKYRNERNVSFTLYGDGACNQGQFYESVNMAKLWDLPVVYVCENNRFGMGTSAQRASASTEFYKRGDFVPGVYVDGMDVIAVREAVRFAREHCVSGKGPIVLELDTYRLCGHNADDEGSSYRKKEEVLEIRKHHDPINKFKEKILACGMVTEEEIQIIDKEIHEEIQAALKALENAETLPVDGLYSDIYANTEPLTIRGCNSTEWVKQKYRTCAEILDHLGQKPVKF